MKTSVEDRILALLARGPLGFSMIVPRAQVSQTSVTHALQRLVDAGQVERTPDETDRRRQVYRAVAAERQPRASRRELSEPPVSPERVQSLRAMVQAAIQRKRMR